MCGHAELRCACLVAVGHVACRGVGACMPMAREPLGGAWFHAVLRPWPRVTAGGVRSWHRRGARCCEALLPCLHPGAEEGALQGSKAWACPGVRGNAVGLPQG